MKHVLAPLALLAARVTVPEPEAGDSIQGCADNGLYLISIRGTTEQRGIGVAGTLIANQVQNQIKGTKIVALDYPATFTDPSYQVSVGDGTKALTKLVSEHVKSCPKDKIAIIGYSQGAQVAMDTICGTDELSFDNTTAIASAKLENHVVAVAVFGDPTYIANVTYNKGTSASNGLFPRKNIDSCLRYADMIASWCDTGDIFCASGDSSAVHGQYFRKYGTDIVKFIVNKATGRSSNSTSSAHPNGTTVHTSTGQPADSTTSVATATTTTTALTTTTATTTTATTTTTPTGTGTSTSAAAYGLTKASRALYVALPLVLAAMFQMA
ncbi:hypothetical protein E4U55_004731 [Claviceps digitariae]|nr:hypothetical protein E4U55_004731 [Claviceps digitariae]